MRHSGRIFGIILNQNFGVIKEEAFEVKVEFVGFAAGFEAERIWSPDQQIQQLPGGKIPISFSASSEPELVAWLLSFGDEARLARAELVGGEGERAGYADGKELSGITGNRRLQVRNKFPLIPSSLFTVF